MPLDGSTNFETILPLIGAVFTFAFGIFTWLKSPKTTVNVLFLAFCIAITYWLFGTYEMFVNRNNPEAAMFWDRFVYMGVVFVPSLMHHFSLAITGNKGQRKLLFFSYLFSFVFLFVSWTPYFVDGLNVFPRVIHTKAQIGHHIFLGLFFAIASIMFYNLARHFRESADSSRKRSIVMTALAFLNILVIGGTAYLPAYGIDIGYPFSYFSGVFFVILLSFALTKGHFFSSRVLVAEMFVFLSSLLFAAYIFLLRDRTELTFTITGFVVILYFGIAMVRSMRQEMVLREQAQDLAAEIGIANTKLKEIDEMKNEFISVASHQLRTPISVMKGYLSLIDEGAYGKVNPRLAHTLKQIFEMNERMVSMVNNLLNISRIERNKIVYTCSPTDVMAVAREMVQHMKINEKKGLRIRLVRGEKNVERCYIDPDKLREVLGNLIDNAMKYTSEGEVTVSVRREKNDELTIRIADTGMGMSKEDAAHAFERFYRAKSTMRQTGTGLGLYICSRFVKAMGGEIWIEKTEIGKGTVFAFTVPINPRGECAIDAPPPVGKMSKKKR